MLGHFKSTEGGKRKVKVKFIKRIHSHLDMDGTFRKEWAVITIVASVIQILRWKKSVLRLLV